MSNYDVTQEAMQRHFLDFDQSRMVERFQLEADLDYLYLPFLSRRYRIDRKTGAAEWLEGSLPHPAGFNEAMSLYDVLCCAKDGCALTGRFAPINSVARTFHSASLGGDLFDGCREIFSQNPAKLALACKALGGVPGGRGDVAFDLPVFPFLPVRLQLWLADEDFPAALQLLWDEGTLDFVHYETTYYIAGHLYQRLSELIERRRYGNNIH
jgi:hypothetical protein